jgi:hypothetical protein
MLVRICLGVVSGRTWYRSPTTLPLRPRTRLTASANRMASPCMPPRARRASSPSTMKCPWSCWMEKWITRNRSTDARPMARRSAPNTRADLSDGIPGAARIVTWSGYRGSTLDRVSCGIEGRPRGFRPAPFRAPAPRACHLERQPQLPSWSRLDSAHVPFVGADGVGARGPCDLIPRMFRRGLLPRPREELPARPRWPRFS